jgi:hypothetical protein
MNLKLPPDAIRPEAACDRLPLFVRAYRDGLSTIRKRSARAIGRQTEHDHRAGHGLMILILHLDHRIPRRPLLNIVDLTLAFDHD